MDTKIHITRYNQMLKLAVVGTGIIGLDHLKAIKMSDKLELVAICDINEEKVKELSVEYGVPYFLDYKEIPEKTDAEAVILNLPHGLHCESSIFFLEAGLDVLLEKPMANTVAECDAMIAAANKSGKKLAIGHIQRFYNACHIVRDYVRSEELGKLCMVHELRSVNYFKPDRPRWFLSKKLAGGGIVMNYGAHLLDKVLFVTGDSVKDVSARCANLKNSEDIEGHAQFFVELNNGVSAAATFSGYCPVGFETIFVFTDGAMKITGVSRVWVNKDGTWVEIPGANDGLHMLRQLEEFYKMVRGEENEMPTAEYGRNIIAAIEDIYKKGL